MWSTHSLPLLPGPLWLTVVAPDMVLIKGQIELFKIQVFRVISSLFHFESTLSQYLKAQSITAGEYTDCISAEEKDSSNKCPEYDT